MSEAGPCIPYVIFDLDGTLLNTIATWQMRATMSAASRLAGPLCGGF